MTNKVIGTQANLFRVKKHICGPKQKNPWEHSDAFTRALHHIFAGQHLTFASSTQILLAFLYVKIKDLGIVPGATWAVADFHHKNIYFSRVTVSKMMWVILTIQRMCYVARNVYRERFGHKPSSGPNAVALWGFCSLVKQTQRIPTVVI